MLTLLITVAATSLQLSIPAEQANTRERALNAYRDGLTHMRAEAFDQAERAFSAAVEIDPTFEMAFYMLGRSQMPQKRYVQAIESFSRARSLSQTSTGARFASAQEAQRYRRDRIMEIDEVVRQLQTGPQTQQIQMQIRQLNERRRLLQEDVQRGGDISITDAVPAYVSLSLGSAYFRAGKFVEAEQAYLEAIRSDPRAGEAHSNLAVVYLETGRYDLAQKAIDAAERVGFRVNPQLKDDIRSRIRDPIR